MPRKGEASKRPRRIGPRESAPLLGIIGREQPEAGPEATCADAGNERAIIFWKARSEPRFERFDVIERERRQARVALGVVRRSTAELLPQRAKRGELDRDSVDLAMLCDDECIVNSKAQIAARRCLHVRSSQRRDPLRPASDEASRSDRPAVSQAMLRRLAYPLQPALASAAPRNLEDRPDERS
jgi:hypothetical protein